MYLEAHIVQHAYAEEGLRQPFHFEPRGFAGGAGHAARLTRRVRTASRMAASRIALPLTASTTNKERPRSCNDLSSTQRKATPASAIQILPRPPKRLTPP